MKKILVCSVAVALASCVQQNVGAPSPAVAPTQPVVILPPAAPAAKVATPVAKKTTTKPAAAPTPQPKATVAVPQAKPSAPVAAPAPLPPMRGTHSSIIQESDKVKSKRSMGGSETYAH